MFALAMAIITGGVSSWWRFTVQLAQIIYQRNILIEMLDNNENQFKNCVGSS